MNHQFEFGDVVLAYVWCDDGKGKKARPCIILEAACGNAYEVAPVTSKQARLGGKMIHEVIIIDDSEKREMGLWKDSRISLLNKDIRTVKKSDVVKRLGRSTRNVLTRCASAWKNAN